MGRRRRVPFRVEDILNCSAEPIFLLSPERQVVFFNRACQELTGQTAEQLAGVRCHYHGPEGSDAAADLAATLAPPPEVLQGSAATVESQFVLSSGERVWRRIHFLPCHDTSGQLLSVIGLVTEQTTSLTGAQAPHLELHSGLLRLRDRLYRRYGFDKIVAASHSMRRVLDQVRLAGQTEANVLIWGEAGTGKELIARTIHRESARKAARFVPIDCALVPPEMLETDLFGPSPAADFTANPDRSGLVHSASGGTLFLRNITKLSRDLQNRLVEALGCSTAASPSNRAEPVHPRLIAGDRSNPQSAVTEGELRPDLYFLLSTLVIHLPPVRDRNEDLLALVQMQVESANARGEKQVAGISPSAIEVLEAYDWPGNARELGEVIERAHAQCRSSLIEREDLMPHIPGAWGTATSASSGSDHRIDLDQVLLQAERKLIETALRRARGNKSRAAELLSISRPRLYRRMQFLGMEEAEPLEPEQEDLGPNDESRPTKDE